MTNNWKLVDEKTGEEIQTGMLRALRDGEQVSISGMAVPHKPSSTGRVYVTYANGASGEYFPSVVGAKFIRT